MNKLLDVLKTIVRILSVILPLIPGKRDDDKQVPEQPAKPNNSKSDE